MGMECVWVGERRRERRKRVNRGEGVVGFIRGGEWNHVMA